MEGDEEELRVVIWPLSLINDMGDFDFRFKLAPLALDFKFMGIVFFVVSVFSVLPLLTIPFILIFNKISFTNVLNLQIIFPVRDRFLAF